MKFLEKLDGAIARSGGLLCIGLDPDYARLPASLRGRGKGLAEPAEAVLEFNRRIVAATADLAAAYKLNLAFYEALGPEGLEALAETVSFIPEGVLKIGDAKRGDIGNTNRAYAVALFEHYRFDAVTLSPYLGLEPLEPFFAYQDRGAFVLCRTSNPGAREFQELRCSAPASAPDLGEPLYRHVARAVARSAPENVGLVVGATAAEELEGIRALIGPERPLLVPGVGAQAGDLERAVRYGLGRDRGRLLINSSRAIIFASTDADFATAARAAAERLWKEINRYRYR